MTIMLHAESAGGFPDGDKGGVPPCLRRLLNPISLNGFSLM
jgi:hypothetical protein